MRKPPRHNKVQRKNTNHQKDINRTPDQDLLNMSHTITQRTKDTDHHRPKKCMIHTLTQICTVITKKGKEGTPPFYHLGKIDFPATVGCQTEPV